MRGPKHTPGPWVVKRTRDVWPDSKSAGVTVVKERGSYEWKGEKKHQYTHICYIPDNPRAQYLANARLICAAPDLLVAIKNLLATIPFQDESNFEAVRAALEAIKSADGGDV